MAVKLRMRTDSITGGVAPTGLEKLLFGGDGMALPPTQVSVTIEAQAPFTVPSWMPSREEVWAFRSKFKSGTGLVNLQRQARGLIVREPLELASTTFLAQVGQAAGTGITPNQLGKREPDIPCVLIRGVDATRRVG